MKTQIILLFILSLTACSKSKDTTTTPPANPDQSYIYTLTFTMENDHNVVYKIQSSIDNINFTTVDSISYDLNKNGIYNYDLKLKKGTYVRVVAADSSATIISDIVVAGN
jgi:hypothetical protein